MAHPPRRRTFVGRATEIARLQSLLEVVVGRRDGRTVVIGGEAGIGKSQLIDRFVAQAATSARVLEGACLDVATDALPYAPLVEVLRGLVRTTPDGHLAAVLGPGRAELTSLLPELASRSADLRSEDGLERASQARLFELLLGVFERLASATALVIVIEDVHWADRSTRDFIAFASRALRDDAVLVVLTERTDVAAEDHGLLGVLAELEREEHVERIELQPFDRDEVAELAAARYGDAPDPGLVDRLLARSDGNPFYLEMLLSEPGAGERGLPPALRDVLAARIAGLSVAAREVIRAAAAAGRRIDDGLLAEVLGLPAARLAAALREAEAAGILVRRGIPAEQVLEFRHELVREVVLAELFPGERAAIHEGLARVLEARAEAGDRAVADVDIASHWDHAGQPERALPHTLRAAAAAERVYAFAEALQLWERAATWLEELPTGAEVEGRDVVEALDRASECALLIGEARHAVDLTQRALVDAYPTGDDARVLNLENRLRWHLWWSGERAAAAAAVQAAAAAIPAEPTVARARVLAQLAGVRMLQGDLAASAQAARDAIETGIRANAIPEIALARGVLGWDLAMLGDVEAGLAEYHEGQAIAEATGSVEGAALAATNMAALLDRIGRSEASLEAAKAGFALTERLGVARTYGAILLGYAAKAQLALGEWDEAERLTALGLRRGAVDAGAVWLLINRARVLIGRGLFDEARRLLERGRAIDDRLGGSDHRTALLAAEAELAVWSGHPEAISGLARNGLTAFAAGGALDPSLAWLAALVLRAVADAGAARGGHRASVSGDALSEQGRALVAEVLAAVGEVAGRAGFVAGDRPKALLALMRAEEGRVRGTSSPASWAAVRDAWAELRRPFQVAYARLREAEAIVATRGSRDDAAAALAEAARISTGLEARPLGELVGRFATQARISLPAGVLGLPSISPVSGEHAPGDLTAREAEVLHLVADGWTNQEIADALFITRKTASVHVSNIMGKLGASNRAEAAAIAHRLGMVESQQEKAAAVPGAAN